jgi:hypothetical protein
MKTVRVLYSILLIVLTLSVLSCRSSKAKDSSTVISGKRPISTSTSSNAATHRLPPGQAKKLNGDKSAKAYAPGQQKKKNKKKKS